MLALERQKKILETLSIEGAVSVSKLSSSLKVTEETVRRDLEKLEKKEMLLRTHGGAVPIDEGAYELSLEKRKKTNVYSKELIAQNAIEHIASGDTIFLDASTTTFYMAKLIKKMANITVITNSLRAINELSSSKNIKLIAIGGVVSRNQSFIGDTAKKTISENFYANKMFFSSRGITLDGGILEGSEEECAIKQEMIKNSGTKYYLCDHSKIGRIGFVKLAPLDKINYFLTDGKPDEAWENKFKELNIIY